MEYEVVPGTDQSENNKDDVEDQERLVELDAEG